MPKLLHVVHGEYANFSKCKTCYKLNIGREKKFVAYKKLRYFSITLWLERLFMSLKTFEHLTYNHSHEAEDGVTMLNDKTWKHFNRVCF
jgi:hypothetical protein